ncbi:MULTISPECIES: hypothetical protein [16SrI (Aster yellows group)]|nr:MULTISPECIES: hypothetical protein [16SrI (Aster yellows group)]
MSKLLEHLRFYNRNNKNKVLEILEENDAVTKEVVKETKDRVK